MGLLLPYFSIAQENVPDSVQLDEVTVQEFQVNAGDEFRHQDFNSDSLVQGRATLAEVLKQNTNIFVRSYGNNGVATISLRGTSGYHTKVYWNNLDLGSPMLGLADPSNIPSTASDKVDIQYGFASLNDGAGGIGGSIRLNSQYASLNDQLVEASIYAGSFGQWQGNARLNLKLKRMGVQIGAQRYSAKNNFPYIDITRPTQPERYMTNAQFDQQSYWTKLYFRLDKNQLLSWKSLYNQVDREIPPHLNGDQSIHDQLLDKSLLSVVEYTRSKAKYRLMASSGVVLADNHFLSGGDSTNSLNQFWSWQNSLRLNYRFSEKLSIESGGRLRLEEANSPSYATGVSRIQSSLFSDWKYMLTKTLKFTAIVRQEWIDQYHSPLLGSVGVVYEINNNHGSRLHAARNYRFPSLNDLYWSPGGNESLLPEISYNFEWGYNLNYATLPKLELSLFHNIISNWIQWTNNQSVWSPANIKKVANSGVELVIKDDYKFGNLKLNWQASYSYTRSRTIEWYSEDTDHLEKQLPYVPFHMLAAGLELNYHQYFMRYQHNFNGLYYTNTDNSIYMPAFSLAYLSFGVRNIAKNDKHLVGINLMLNNLFDYDYQLLPYRPEQGFNLGVRVTYGIAR